MGMYWDHNVPDAAHQFIGAAMAKQGVAVIAYPPGGGWVAVGIDGSYEAHGIPQECFDTLVSFRNNGWTIRSIAFPPAGGNSWVIIADQGYFARNIPAECFSMIESFVNGGSHISCVAFPPSGGNSWAIVANNAIYARNIDDECYQFLWNYTQPPRRATHVTFAPNGGWTIYGAGAFYARNLDNACYQQMVAFAGGGWLLEQVAFTPSGGYSIICNQKAATTADPIRSFETAFFEDATGHWHTIWDRMASYGVPGASVAMVQHNAVAWRTAYGKLQAGHGDYVHPDTAFQAASISKPHAAAGVLRMIQDTPGVALGDAIASHTSWPVAVRACAQAAWANQATIQLTLEHKGGFVGRGNTFTNPPNGCNNFTGDGGGFGGYPNVPGVQVPTLDQILAGTAPANSPKIEITTQPGAFYYSGMGFMVLMRMVQDVTHTDFRTWMHDRILSPLKMTGSTFEMTLPPALARAAVGHDVSGNPIAGLRNRYPEAPAAGLYTNAGDLCRFVAMLNAGGTLDGVQVLDATRAGAMLTNQLGIFTAGQPGQPGYLFNHNGGNYGFSAFMQGYPTLRAGMAVMTNRDDGDQKASAFYGEAVAALKRVYSLP